MESGEAEKPSIHCICQAFCPMCFLGVESSREPINGTTWLNWQILFLDMLKYRARHYTTRVQNKRRKMLAVVHMGLCLGKGPIILNLDCVIQCKSCLCILPCEGIYDNESVTLSLTMEISEDISIILLTKQWSKHELNSNSSRSPCSVILDQRLLRSVVQIPRSNCSSMATFLNDLKTKYCVIVSKGYWNV